MQAVDWWVVAGYFAALTGLAWYVVAKSKRTAADYFLAGHGLPWFIIGASIFASNIGSEHLVGLAGSGATDGVAMAHYELHAWCLLVLAWIMVPFFMRAKVFTTPEFIEKRFSPASRTILSVIMIIAYILSKIAVGIYAGGVVFSALLPDLHLPLFGRDWNSFWIGSVLVVVLTGMYTVAGGLRAVAYTEAFQTIIFVVGSAVITWFGLRALGDGSLAAGWEKLRTTCGSEMFNLWRPMVPKGVEGTWAPVIQTAADGQVVKQAWYFNKNYPWLGMLFCAPIVGLWYWCTDQHIVQRAIAAPDERGARRGSVFAAILKLLPVFIFIIPGMIAYALAKTGTNATLAHHLFPDGTLHRDNAQAAFPLMVLYGLPTGIRGLVVAGLLAALMSSLAGVFNACSTLFTIDLYQKWNPKASQAKLVWMGRVATTVSVLIALAWIPVIQGAKGLYDYLQGVQAYVAPPIFAVFFLGVFVRRTNAKGCLAALAAGFAMGLFRLVIDTPVALKMDMPGLVKGQWSEGSFFWILNNMNFQYYSALIFLVSCVVMLVVSYLTTPPPREKLEGLTYGMISAEERAVSRASWNWVDVLISLVVIAGIGAAYLYFTG